MHAAETAAGGHARRLPFEGRSSGSPKGRKVNLRFFDWIWHVRGSVPLPPGQTNDEAFERLDPLFHEVNTSHERSGSTLTFRKWDQAAQDKMSIFEGGTLRIEENGEKRVLRFHMTSRALLFCFLAPLLFLAFAQFTAFINKLDTPADDPVAEQKENEHKKLLDEMPLHPIDKFLGAPGPKKADEKKEGKEAKDKKDDKPEEKHSATPAYVFAGIFAALYAVGRVLEDWLVRRLFRRRLAGTA
jgi:hypothetical protein